MNILFLLLLSRSCSLLFKPQRGVCWLFLFRFLVNSRVHTRCSFVKFYGCAVWLIVIVVEHSWQLKSNLLDIFVFVMQMWQKLQTQH